jgi:6-phosphofructokinase 1
MGMRGNRVVRIPLEACVSDSRRVNEALEAREFDHALELRGASFNDALRTFNTLQRALPHPPREGRRRLRLGILHAGAAAPGMNAAVRAAVRLATDDGHVALGIRRGFPGLAAGELSEMDWMSVNGWAPMGGAELGTSREVPAGPDLYAIARTIELHAIDGILVIGGWEAYDGAHRLFDERKNFPAFNIPIICLPATIDNNLPGTELSIGADTALNNIVSVVDKIKQAAVAEQRCYVVEVMGRRCGYLATMSGLATGAERVYLHEDGITLKGLVADLELLVQGFRSGKRLGLMIRSEGANDVYNTAFICALFEEEGGGLFDVRQSILGHLQQGGDPSPFDRIQATRLARLSIRRLAEQAAARDVAAEFIGMRSGNIEFGALEDYPRLIDAANRRPKQQWWLEVRKINETLSRPAPRVVPASTET